MGLSCFTGSVGFDKGLRGADGITTFYKNTGKILMRPLGSQAYFDLYKVYLASTIIRSNNKKHLRERAKKVLKTLEPKLLIYDARRVQFLKKIAYELRKNPRLNYKGVVNSLFTADRLWLELEFLQNPTHAFGVGGDGKLKITKINETAIRNYFVRELELIEVDPLTRKAILNELNEAIEKAKLGNFTHLDSLIDRVVNASMIETLPHTGGLATFAGVMTAWWVIMVKDTAKDYESWHYENLIKRHCGENPSPECIKEIHQYFKPNVFDFLAEFSDYQYHNYIESDYILQKNLKWKIWNDREILTYYIAKNIGLPFIGETLSGIAEERFLIPLAIRSLQFLALRSPTLVLPIVRTLFSAPFLGMLTAGVLSMTVAFLGGLVIEGALALAFHTITRELFDEAYRRRVEELINQRIKLLYQIKKLERELDSIETLIENLVDDPPPKPKIKISNNSIKFSATGKYAIASFSLDVVGNPIIVRKTETHKCEFTIKSSDDNFKYAYAFFKAFKPLIEKNKNSGRFKVATYTFYGGLFGEQTESASTNYKSVITFKNPPYLIIPVYTSYYYSPEGLLIPRHRKRFFTKTINLLEFSKLIEKHLNQSSFSIPFRICYWVPLAVYGSSNGGASIIFELPPWFVDIYLHNYIVDEQNNRKSTIGFYREVGYNPLNLYYSARYGTQKIKIVFTSSDAYYKAKEQTLKIINSSNKRKYIKDVLKTLADEEFFKNPRQPIQRTSPLVFTPLDYPLLGRFDAIVKLLEIRGEVITEK